MKKLLYILTFFLLLGCSKEEEVVLEPLFEISLDGQSFEETAKANNLKIIEFNKDFKR